MTNITKIPPQDKYESSLAQTWDGAIWLVYVNAVPEVTSWPWYLVVDPDKTNIQVAEFDWWDSVAKTFNVTSVTIKKGTWTNYSTTSHWSGAVVRISDNYQYWEDIKTVVNTKLDQDGWNGLDYADTAARDAALWANGAATENYRMIKAGANYYNYNLTTAQWEVIDTGTAPGNASTAAAGIVEAPTTPQQVAWTTTWETGALLFSTPDYVKSINDTLTTSIDTEKLKIKSKQDVVCATTANITLSGTQTIDWVAVVATNRVLVKDQTAGAENGIYLCAAGAWTRAVDFDSNVNNEVDFGAEVCVQWGTVWAGTKWMLSTTGAITVGTTALVFTQTFPLTQYISSAAVSGSVSVPATANICWIEATCTNWGTRIGKGDLVLSRVGKTTASLQFAETNGTANDPEFVASWSGSTITITGDSVWGTCYFYKGI